MGKPWTISAKVGLACAIPLSILVAAGTAAKEGAAEALLSATLSFFLWWLIVWFVGRTFGSWFVLLSPSFWRFHRDRKRRERDFPR